MQPNLQMKDMIATIQMIFFLDVPLYWSQKLW